MRVLITGASGSGTTTLGQALAAALDWNIIDADDYFWLPTEPPFEKKRNPEKRLELILKSLSNSANSVVSGSIMNWGIELESSFDLVVFLYLESKIRVQRVEEREIRLYGKANIEFLTWVSEYDTGPEEGRSLAKHNLWLSKQESNVIRIEGDLTVQERIDAVFSALPNKFIKDRLR